MRVTSDRQTLILAGETPPRRSMERYSSPTASSDYATDGAAAWGKVARSPDDAGRQVEFAVALPTPPPKLYQAYIVPNRGSSSYAADAYARTRDLSDRTSFVDTYA